MNLLLAALLDKPSVLPGHCAICGAHNPNKHHVIVGERRNPRVPLIHLCGSGTTGCHGEAHKRTLHFRYMQHWEYLLTTGPVKYEHALDMDGWRPL